MRKCEGMKRLLSLLLCAVLVLGMVPVPALAEEGAPCTVTADCTGVYANGICTVCGKVEPTAEGGAGDADAIITLKSSFLETLSAGKHTIQVNYTDGNTGGEDYFRISINNGNPITGDDFLFTPGVLKVYIPRKELEE